MKTAYIALLIGSFLAFLPGCGGCSCEKKRGLVLVNVLDKELYQDCRIKGSINVPFDMIETLADQVDKDEAEIVVYCSNYQCASSEYAARKLKKKGFKVAVYEGGMAEWYQQGLPVEGPQMQAYLKKSCTPMVLENDSEIPIITVDELAQKMGIAKEKKGAA